MTVTYVHLKPGQDPLVLTTTESKCVVVIEDQVSDAWRNILSTWIVDCGCLYMMAWGKDCSAWDDSVDCAGLEKFDFEDGPPESLVMTTWHENESLEEVFRFSKTHAEHPTVALMQTVILHIAAASREDELLRMYEAA